MQNRHMDQRVRDLSAPQTWAFPLTGGLIFAAFAVGVTLPSTAHPLTWAGLFSRTGLMLLLSAITAIAGTSLLRRPFGRHFDALRSDLLCCAWGAAIWIPLCLLLQSEHAVWCVLAPIPATVIVVSFSRWQLSPHDVATWEERARRSELFGSVAALQGKLIANAVIVSAVLLEASIAAAASQAYSIAESLVLIATACIVWHTTPEPAFDSHPQHVKAGRRSAGVFACFLLTCLSMTPFLQAGQSTFPLGSMVLAGAKNLAPHAPVKTMAGSVYSGVVLLAPPLPKRKLIEPPPKAMVGGLSTVSKPLIIPFDGSYWFYQQGENAPGKDAPVQRGDPIKNHIRSTNFYPLLMEAHQRLGATVNAACCHALTVTMTNADNRLGVIEVEVVLRDIGTGGTRSHSLGVVPIRSSQAAAMSIYRSPTQETLRFPMHVNKEDRFRFNEITLIFHLSPHRNLANAEVKVKEFTLVP